MPVTKTAKRALRSSEKKASVNKIITSKLSYAIRKALKSGSLKDISVVYSLADRASKKKLIHKNKASRIKARISNALAKATKKETPKKVVKKSKPSKKISKK